MTRRDDPFSGFGNFITSEDELEAVSEPAMPQAVD